MIVIERTYTARKCSNAISKDVTETERRVFKDDDFERVQEFISKEGTFNYVKL